MKVEALLNQKTTRVFDDEMYEFVNIKDVYNSGLTDFVVSKLYSAKTKFGKQYVVVCNEKEFRMSAPKHLNNVIDEIILCDNYNDLLKEKKLKIRLYEYTIDLGIFVGMTFIVE